MPIAINGKQPTLRLRGHCPSATLRGREVEVQCKQQTTNNKQPTTNNQYDSEYHRSDVVILDGRDLNRGAMATIHLQHHIPYGLHGSWTPECFV